MNLYIGNLSKEVMGEELRQVFEQFGRVDSVKIIIDRETGISRGFGFVEMPNREEAVKAYTALNETELRGRRLKVNEARPRPGRY